MSIEKKAESDSQVDAISSESFPTQEALPYRGVTVTPEDENVIQVKDWFASTFSHPGPKAWRYLKSLFPIFGWITHYPFMPQWIWGDFVAGLSVAIVLIPQAMSYAQLATLEPEYGLYSSFIGLMMYSFFATSKDVSIGPVAVMSLEVGKIITRVQDKTNDGYEAHEIATTLALLCGSITLGIGLLRIGFIVELIPLPAVLAFMAGSALNIMAGQVPALMGFSKLVGNRDATYKIIINSLKNLKHSKVDAAFGLVCLVILYAWRWAAARLYKRYPTNKLFFYLQHIRAAIVIIFATVASFAIVHNLPGRVSSTFTITGTIASGLGDVGRFVPPDGLCNDLASELPVATVILVLEHIAIAKSFGRINDYKINPNQEFIAIGVTNMVGTFFNAYPATGSFSRTALKSKCGVRTPFAGLFGGSCVLLAIYCFASAFYYIPKAALSAIIIHAVSDLVPSWRVTWNLYLVTPLDCAIFIIGLLITIFTSIEDGIYFAVCAAAVLIFWRLCITNGVFLGRVKIAETLNPKLQANGSAPKDIVFHYRWVPLPGKKSNPSFVHTRYINDEIEVLPPPPGVLVYRMSESFIYPNSSRQADAILDEIKSNFRDHRSNREPTFNNPGPLIVRNPFKEIYKNIKNIGKHKETTASNNKDFGWDPNDKRPPLKVLHLDFSQVVAIDTTAVQSLIDLKKAIELHSGTEYEIHFSGIINPWVIRGLVNGGFGGRDVKAEKNAAARAARNSTIDEEIEEDRPVDPESSPDTDDLISVISTTNNQPQGPATNSHYLEAGVSHGELRALYDSRHPHFHFDIPSYSEFEA